MEAGFMWGPLALFAAVMTLTPGPNVVLVTASGANFGFCRTVPQMLGITLGFGFMALASGFGMAGLVRTESRLHGLLKYAGAAYLVYLAWRIGSAGAGSADGGTDTKPIGFLEAVLFTCMNPKAWISVLGAIATFGSAGGNVLLQTSAIAGVLAAFCLLSCMVWAAFGTAVGRFLAAPRIRTAFNLSMAVLLVLSLVPVLV
jgi:threonine/homoserine/homoserine lactone efflux protein